MLGRYDTDYREYLYQKYNPGMEVVKRMDRQEVKKTNGADFGTSELIRYLKIINGFLFPLPLNNYNQQEDYDDRQKR